MAAPILHLMTAADWRAVTPDAPWRPDSLDSHGFVHCSPDDATLLAVANAVYRDTTEPMVVLSIDPDRLTAPTRWEAPVPTRGEAPPGAPPPGTDTTVFPHVYGPIEYGAVTAVRYARRDLDGRYVAFEPRPATADRLDLFPCPEGGWYRPTWAASVRLSPPGYTGTRASATATLFLLDPDDETVWHRVSSDELWLRHRGSLALTLGGTGPRPDAGPTLVLGGDVMAGQLVQALVPARTWRAAKSVGAEEVLVSRVVSPGLDGADGHDHH